MKIRSLLLGSIAAAGLTTGAYAADPLQVLTTLNLCDALGLTGLTVASSNNCLQISGEVKYEFSWGDYKGSPVIAYSDGGYDNFTIIDNDSHVLPLPGGRDQDWYSKVEAYFKVVGTADTDVGPAKVVIKMKDIYERQTRNENNLGVNNVDNANFYIDTFGADGIANTADDFGVDGLSGTADDFMRYNGPDGIARNADDVTGLRSVVIDDYAGIGGDDTGGFVMDEAYVAIGGATVLMAGKKGSIMNMGDDVPFNWLTLFLSEKVDAGVKWTKDLIPDGGHVIQLIHDFGNGLSGGVGLENLQGTGAKAGTAVGVLAYAGDKITAHVTVAAGGILDGTVENWGLHAGITGTFNMIKVRGAIAGDSTGYWNGMASAEATFNDMFKLAVSAEAANKPSSDYGVGASASITVTDGVTINLGGRWYHDGTLAPVGPRDGYQIAAQLVAAVTETLTLTGEVGVFGVSGPGTTTNLSGPASATDVYGKVILAWAPGGGFTTSIAGEVHQNGGYKATFKAGKPFD